MRTGHVYCIVRRDLKTGYVGQSIDYLRRVSQHRISGRAEVKGLWADKNPEVWVAGPIEWGPELDQLELYVMNDVEAQGVRLLNVLRGERWDSHEVRSRAARLGGLRGGATNAASGHMRRIQKIGSSLGGKSSWKRPDRDKTHSANLISYVSPEQRSINGRTGILKAMALHPETFQASRTANGAKMGPVNSAKKRECVVCGMISNQPALGLHQKRSGHVGYRDLPNSTIQ